MLGGGMRQAGVIAAAGLVALRTGIGRLREDHEQARQLAARLAALPGLTVGPVETTFVMIDTAAWGIGAAQLVAELKSRGIAASARPPYTVRFVTHRQVGEAEAGTLVAALREISGQ
jgi:threonine aldolase